MKKPRKTSAAAIMRGKPVKISSIPEDADFISNNQDISDILESISVVDNTEAVGGIFALTTSDGAYYDVWIIASTVPYNNHDAWIVPRTMTRGDLILPRY